MWKKTPGLLFDVEGEALQKFSKDKIVLEIGSFLGKSSVCIAEVAKQLTCVDTFKADPKNSEDQNSSIFKEFSENTKEFKNISVFKGTSNKFFKAAKVSLHVKFDFIFIDGAHNYEQVKKDIKNAKRHLNEGGLIACHDYNNIEKHAGVKKAVNELLEIIEKHGTLVVCK